MNEEHGFVKLVEGWGETQFGPNMSWIDTSSRFSLDKIAKAMGTPTTYIPGSLREKIAEIQGKLPRDKVAFYNRALGTAESYGLNKNGDQWRRGELVRKHATFVDNAKYFRHHANKESDPFYGRPIASAFNERTDMVDLIILADLDKQAEDDIQRLERGLSVPTSMGCRVKFDVCLICAHQARHRGEYCEHVKEGASSPHGMCQVLPDGRICGVDNPDPVFFDISRVTNPAFYGSENLLKVAAGAGGDRSKVIVVSSARRAEDAGLVKKTTPERPVAKTAATSLGQKIADMIKELPGRIDAAVVPGAEKIDAMAGVTADICARAARVPGDKLVAMAKKAGAERVLATAAALGMVLSPDEFGELAGASIESPTAEAILACGVTKAAGAVMDAAIDDEIARVLSPYAKDRSFLQPILLSSMSKAADHCKCTSDMKSCGHFKCVGGIPQSGDKKPKAHDKAASAAYVAYRAALLAGMRSVDDASQSLAAKLAETNQRYVTPTSSAFALLAFCRGGPENQDVVRVQLLAKQSSVADTHRETLRVSGSMADDFGEDVMELMADNFLQSTRS